MNFNIKLCFWFGFSLFVAGVVYLIWNDGNNEELIGVVILFANAIFFWFIALMLKLAPGLEYMSEHGETGVDRGESIAVEKEQLALPPPPKGMHIPGPSYWPIGLAIGIMLFVSGLVFDIKVNAFTAIGAFLLILAGAGWMTQDTAESEELVTHQEHLDAEQH